MWMVYLRPFGIKLDMFEFKILTFEKKKSFCSLIDVLKRSHIKYFFTMGFSFSRAFLELLDNCTNFSNISFE